jgi:ferric-dicitrate binding protein FerR (iron transport regulator)
METITNTEHIDNLILTFLQGKMSPEEKVELENWLALNKENRAEFKRLHAIWKAASIQNFENEEIQSAFERVTLHTLSQKQGRSARTLKNTSSRVFLNTRRWAAIFIGIVVLSSVFFYFNSKVKSLQDNLQATNIISVPLGAKSKITLPDGTEVWLNAGSKLTYNMGFGQKTREVSLTGEGYFKVAKQKEKPFIVHTVKANIKALGTEFNVKAYPDEDFIETILVEGSVAVNQVNNENKTEKAYDKKPLILKPGQKARISKGIETSETKVQVPKADAASKPAIEAIKPVSPQEITLQHADTQVETSWKDERWIITGETMDDLSVLLSRRFNVSITLTSGSLLKYKFSGTIQNETLEQVFRIMSLTIPITYAIDKGKVTVGFNNRFEERYKAAYK